MNQRALLGVWLVFVASSCGGTASEPGESNGGPAGAVGYTGGKGGVGGASGRSGAGSGGKSGAGAGGGAASGAAAGGAAAGGSRAGSGQAGAADDSAGGADELAGAAGSSPDDGAAGARCIGGQVEGNACSDGSVCSVNQDCSGAYCKDLVCTDHCTSGQLEADESDEDCGGASCAPCQDTLHCAQDSDCASHVCDSNSCQHPTCSDQTRNQDESDKDCGGVCADAKPCANDAGCNAPSDCASYVCTNKKCVADLVVAAADVIDDFEDGNVLLPTPASNHGNRVGSWYTFGDGGGVSSREVVAMKRGPSVKVLHTTGAGFNNWGSGISVDFNNDGTTKKPYDASGHSAVTFWARAGKTTS
ncbi:MAG: hypothetical protein WDO56_01865 [Gammaproteobacteria bacterium]